MSKKNNILTAPVVSKALRAGDLCILQDGGSLTLEVTGKNQGKWLYRGRKQGSRTLIKLIGKLYIVFHSSNAALRASILEYLGVEGLNIINSKGIPCSRIAVFRNIFTAVVIFKPSSLKISSA